jgi:type IV pilus assembly protein PilW
MKRQRGVTLIEIMISMMLGLGLIAGIGQLFIQSQKSFTLQRNLSDMTDDATFALEDLAKGVLLAGYAEDGSAVADYIGSNSTDSTLYYSFKLGDLSQRNNSICLAGSSTTISDKITVNILIENTDDLSCVSGAATQPLIQNVEKLVLKYGIRNKTNGTFYYTDAATITAASNWANVFAVKVFLVLHSEDDHLTRNKGYYYDIDGNKVTMTDNRLYKTFSKTIFLRTTAQ